MSNDRLSLNILQDVRAAHPPVVFYATDADRSLKEQLFFNENETTQDLGYPDANQTSKFSFRAFYSSNQICEGFYINGNLCRGDLARIAEHEAGHFLSSFLFRFDKEVQQKLYHPL